MKVEVREARVVVVVVVVEGSEERDRAVDVGDDDDDDEETVEGEEGEIDDEREEKEEEEEETEPCCFVERKGRKRKFNSCSRCCPLTEVSPVALGAGGALVPLAGATEEDKDEELELGVGMLREPPPAPQTCCAKASVTGGKGKENVSNGWKDSLAGRGEKQGWLTLLVCDGADVFNLAVQRGHELGVAADAGEVGFGAAGGGYAGLGCG